MNSLRPRLFVVVLNTKHAPNHITISFSIISIVIKRSQPISASKYKMWNRCFRCCFPGTGTALVIFPLVVFICSTNLDLRFSHTLCDKEKQFREARREKVMLGIKKLLCTEDPCHPEEVWNKIILTHILHANCFGVLEIKAALLYSDLQFGKWIRLLLKVKQCWCWTVE